MEMVRFTAGALLAMLLTGCQKTHEKQTLTTDASASTPRTPTSSEPSTAPPVQPRQPEPPQAVPLATNSDDFVTQASVTAISPPRPRRYPGREMTYRAVQGCQAPHALLLFPFPDRKQQLKLLARVVAEFPEFHVGELTPGDDHSVELRDARFVPGGRYDDPGQARRYPLVAACTDALSCAEFAWLAAVATELRAGLGCANFEGVEVKEALTLPPQPTSAPRGREACARATTCTVKNVGSVWACSTFEDHAVEKCAAHADCGEVYACLLGLDRKGAGPSTPKPAPALSPPGF